MAQEIRGPTFPPAYERSFMNQVLVIFGPLYLDTWRQMPKPDGIVILAERAKELCLPGDAITVAGVLVFAYRVPGWLRGEEDLAHWRALMAELLPHPGPDGARPEKLSFTVAPDDPDELLIVTWSAGGLATQGVHARQIRRYAAEIEAAYAAACERFPRKG